jgi:hypothetical protein
MIHRRRPWLGVLELQKLLVESKSLSAIAHV